MRRRERAGSRVAAPQPGEVWRSRDRRDDGLLVRVLCVSAEYVVIRRRERQTRVHVTRFGGDYERTTYVSDSDAPTRSVEPACAEDRDGVRA